MDWTTILKTGLTGQRTVLVTEELTAKHLGSGSAAVFATPFMIALMEGASIDTVKPFIPDGWSTVGTRVNVSHLASTPMGQAVRADAELVEIDRRRLVFRVTAYNGTKLIGEGTHERFIIDLEKFGKT
ncbi:MAG: thioesterase family protein [Spirochaetaceae bacterium]|jgi:predicted thioesterase|nr:thioesterase family protein [Spirochaetaceae bacterium]